MGKTDLSRNPIWPGRRHGLKHWRLWGVSVPILMILRYYVRRPRRLSNDATIPEPAADIQHFRIMVKGGYGPNLVVASVVRSSPTSIGTNRRLAERGSDSLISKSSASGRRLRRSESNSLRIGSEIFPFPAAGGCRGERSESNPMRMERSRPLPEDGNIVGESRVGRGLTR